MKEIFNNVDIIGKSFFAIIVVFAILGSFFKFYQKFSWWDLLLHFISGICFVSIGLGIARCVADLELKYMLIFSFTFSITIQVFWEVIEFLCDQFLGVNMQRWHFDSHMPDTHGKIIDKRTPGIIDTMTDFIMNIIGAFVMCIVYLI